MQVFRHLVVVVVAATVVAVGHYQVAVEGVEEALVLRTMRLLAQLVEVGQEVKATEVAAMMVLTKVIPEVEVVLEQQAAEARETMAAAVRACQTALTERL